MPIDLNPSDSAQFSNLTEINLSPSDESSITIPSSDSNGSQPFLCTQTSIFSEVNVPINTSTNPVLVFTALADVTNYKVWRFSFQGALQRRGSNLYNSYIKWNTTYHHPNGEEYSDGIEIMAQSSLYYTIVDPSSLSNYLYYASFDNKFYFYMDIRKFGTVQTWQLVGTLDIFAGPIYENP